MAAAEGLGVTTYNPLAAGLLTGKYGASRRPETGRLTSNQMYQARYGESAYIEIAEAFVALAREHGHHPAALAIAWVASHPAVTAAVMGARTLEQLDDCLGAADIEMTAELRDSISALSPAPPPATDRTEEAGPHRHAVR
jgi:aryl-alcohol dehydrogenase-like predicted oxidoreductase